MTRHVGAAAHVGDARDVDVGRHSADRWLRFENQEMLARAFSDFPSSNGSVLVLGHYMGLTGPEIAAATGVSLRRSSHEPRLRAARDARCARGRCTGRSPAEGVSPMNRADRTDPPDGLGSRTRAVVHSLRTLAGPQRLVRRILDQTIMIRQHRRPYAVVRTPGPALILPRRCSSPHDPPRRSDRRRRHRRRDSRCCPVIRRRPGQPCRGPAGNPAGTSAFGNRTVARRHRRGPGLVAIGGAVTGTHELRPRGLRLDGIAWTEQASAATFDNLVAQRIARHGSTLVAIGKTCSGRCSTLCD